jgi:hypothetical protein
MGKTKRQERREAVCCQVEGCKHRASHQRYGFSRTDVNERLYIYVCEAHRRGVLP